MENKIPSKLSSKRFKLPVAPFVHQQSYLGKNPADYRTRTRVKTSL